MKKIALILRNKKGSQMTEAAISLPVAILAAMLLIRLLVFYLEILTTGIDEHRKAMEAMDAYRGAAIHIYETEKNKEMFKGGLLKTDVSKNIHTKAYLINEDFLVRSGEAVD